VRGASSADARWQAIHAANGCARRGGAFGVDGVDRLYLSSNCLWLAGPECDDAPDRVVRRNSHGHAITRDDFDTEAAHSAAKLGEHFMAGVTLHAIKPATVHGDDCALHVNQIILAQLLANPFVSDKHYAISVIWPSGYLVIWSMNQDQFN
jgi:hypothetical protein